MTTTAPSTLRAADESDYLTPRSINGAWKCSPDPGRAAPPAGSPEAHDCTRLPLFTWKPIPGARSYFVVVAKDASFTEIIDLAITQVPAYAPRNGKSPWTYPDDTTPYYWAVVPAADPNGNNAPYAPLENAPQSFPKRSRPAGPPLSGASGRQRAAPTDSRAAHVQLDAGRGGADLHDPGRNRLDVRAPGRERRSPTAPGSPAPRPTPRTPSSTGASARTTRPSGACAGPTRADSSMGSGFRSRTPTTRSRATGSPFSHGRRSRARVVRPARGAGGWHQAQLHHALDRVHAGGVLRQRDLELAGPRELPLRRSRGCRAATRRW